MSAPALQDLRHARNRAAFQEVRLWGRNPRLAQAVKGLPVLVRSMGIASAVALLASRPDTHALAEALASWLTRGCPVRFFENVDGDGVGAFLAAYAKASQHRAHALDEEGLRFAEALKLLYLAVHGDAERDEEEADHGEA